MRQLSESGRQRIHEVAQRHGFSDDGVLSMLQAVLNGNGSMAQFSHPDFSGSGQWMRGGMTMVSDMFNYQLKGRVDSLCSELSNLIASGPHLMTFSGSFQSQSQGQAPDNFMGHYQSSMMGSGQQPQSGFAEDRNSSLFVPATRENTGQWWPEDLGQPSSTGSQNEMRYAYFPGTRRLALNVNGKVSVYDTQNHQIGGFSQQQSDGSSVTFTSQFGVVSVLNLPIVYGESLLNQSAPAPSSPSVWEPTDSAKHVPVPDASGSIDAQSHDVFTMIEKLAGLLANGYISPQEFAEKKKDLLSRL